MGVGAFNRTESDIFLFSLIVLNSMPIMHQQILTLNCFPISCDYCTKFDYFAHKYHI